MFNNYTALVETGLGFVLRAKNRTTSAKFNLFKIYEYCIFTSNQRKIYFHSAHRVDDTYLLRVYIETIYHANFHVRPPSNLQYFSGQSKRFEILH